MAQVSKLQRDRNNGQFVSRQVIASGQTGAPIALNQEINLATIGLYCNSSSGKVQVTLDPVSMVEADTATWEDWAPGVVSSTTIDGLTSPVTCVRGVSSSGEVILKIVG